MNDEWEVVDLDDINDLKNIKEDFDEIKANNILQEDIKFTIQPKQSKLKKFIKKSALYLLINTVKSPHVWINLVLITAKAGIETDWRLNILCSSMGLCFIAIKNRSIIYRISKFFF